MGSQRVGHDWTTYTHTGSSDGKASACNAGDLGSIPGLGRSPGEGNGNPLQYSGLENSMDCIVHGVAKSRTRLSDFDSLLWGSSGQLEPSFRSPTASNDWAGKSGREVLCITGFKIPSTTNFPTNPFGLPWSARIPPASALFTPPYVPFSAHKKEGLSGIHSTNGHRAVSVSPALCQRWGFSRMGKQRRPWLYG